MVFPDYGMSHEKGALLAMAYIKQVCALRPFKRVVKPLSVWGHQLFGLDRETWEVLWTETEGYL